MMVKKCAICGNEFESRSNNAKYCSDECRKTGRSERLRLYQRKYYRKNRERYLECLREYRRSHLEEIKAYQREYYRAHREEIKAQQREYYRAHREEISARRRRGIPEACPYNEDCLNCPNEGGCLYE